MYKVAEELFGNCELPTCWCAFSWRSRHFSAAAFLRPIFLIWRCLRTCIPGTCRCRTPCILRARFWWRLVGLRQHSEVVSENSAGLWPESPPLLEWAHPPRTHCSGTVYLYHKPFVYYRNQHHFDQEPDWSSIYLPISQDSFPWLTAIISILSTLHSAY